MDENTNNKSLGSKVASIAIDVIAIPVFAAWAFETACKRRIAQLGWDFAQKRMSRGDFDQAIDLMDDRSWARTKSSADFAAKAVETFLYFGDEKYFEAFFNAASKNAKPVALEKLSQTVKDVLWGLTGSPGTFGDERLELQGESGRKSRRDCISLLALSALASSWDICDQKFPRKQRLSMFPEPSQKHYAFHTETTNDPLDLSMRIWLMLANSKGSASHAEAALTEASLNFLMEMRVAKDRVVAGESSWSESLSEWERKASIELEARELFLGTASPLHWSDQKKQRL